MYGFQFTAAHKLVFSYRSRLVNYVLHVLILFFLERTGFYYTLILKNINLSYKCTIIVKLCFWLNYLHLLTFINSRTFYIMFNTFQLVNFNLL